MIEIESSGPLALIQDLGRPGYAHLGVSPSGAADRAALRAANRLVGNPEDAAAIEITLGGFRMRTDRPLWCAVTGPPVVTRIGRTPSGSHHPAHLRAGQALGIDSPATGLRNYLAVRGGIGVEPVLGSRSADLLAGLGPEPLRTGDRLAVGQPLAPMPDTDLGIPAEAGGPVDLPVTPGPREDWFTAPARHRLLDAVWTAGADSDRTAVRLQGPALQRANSAELPSEGLIRGAVQVPASGLPLIFGADHPTTGGYPVIAVLTAEACDRAGQLRPGDRVRFRRPAAVRSAPAVGWL